MTPALPRWTALLLALLAAAACTRSEPPPAGPRLASLSPAITETIGALGAMDQLIARSDFCTLPAQARSLPTAGTALTPELERLAAMRPTHILIDGSLGTRADDLRRLAPTEQLPWLTVDEVVASTRRLGELTDRRARASEIAAEIQGALVADAPAGAPVVLAVIGSLNLQDGEVWYIKRNSLHGAALHAAGMRNAIDRDVAGPPTLALEALVALDPPAILILDASGDPAKEPAILADWQRLSTLRAVRDGRVRVLSRRELFATGPSILETVDALRAIAPALTPGEPR